MGKEQDDAVDWAPEHRTIRAMVRAMHPQWGDQCSTGLAVIAKTRSRRGRLSKARHLFTVPAGVDGRPMACMIRRTLGLPEQTTIWQWAKSWEKPRAIVLWTDTGDLSPVRESAIEPEKRVMSIASIVNEFKIPVSTNRGRPMIHELGYR